MLLVGVLSKSFSNSTTMFVFWGLSDGRLILSLNLGVKDGLNKAKPSSFSSDRVCLLHFEKQLLKL